MPRTKVQPDTRTRETTAREPSWRVVVANDPVNTMEYVTACFVRVLQVARPEAHRLMLEVHEEGRAVVWTGARERAEGLAQELQRWHLRAQLETDG